MSTGKVALGALAGLAIGAIAGILFAPEKGSATRKQLMDKSEGYADDLKSKFDELRDSLTEKFESTIKDMEGFAGKGKSKFDEAKKDVKNAASNLRNDIAADINNATS